MSDLILGADMALVVPLANGRNAVLDMREIYRAEGRLIELRGVTKLKAGELIHTFIEAWSRAAEYVGQLDAELARAKSALNRVRAVVVLDKAPEQLKQRGLSSSRSPGGSEDLRNAVVSCDKDYQAAEEVVIQTTAAIAFMKTKVEKFKMAYFSVDRDAGPVRRDTSGGTGDEDLGTMTHQEKVERFVNEHATINPKSYEGSGFGAPKL